MREFFRGWRRKTGCVTLVMACLFVGAWLRSLIVRDQIGFWIQGSLRQMASEAGTLRFGHSTWDGVDVEQGFMWTRAKISDPLSGVSSDEFWKGIDVKWRLSLVGFDFGKGVEFDHSIERWAIPYWSLAIPLMILSAWLILWKPRKAK